MAFDDSTGGLDRRAYHAPEPIWGDDWGDRKPRRVFEAARTFLERDEVDSIARQKYLARRAEIAADATRSRAAPVEEKIRQEILAQSKTVMGAAMRAAVEKRQRQNGKEKPVKTGA